MQDHDNNAEIIAAVADAHEEAVEKGVAASRAAQHRRPSRVGRLVALVCGLVVLVGTLVAFAIAIHHATALAKANRDGQGVIEAQAPLVAQGKSLSEQLQQKCESDSVYRSENTALCNAAANLAAAPTPTVSVTNGENGRDGRDGSIGSSGPPGPSGPSGPSGPPGPNGPQGDTGNSGAAGSGVNGKDGQNGKDGADGAPGQNGADGAPGASGQPPASWTFVYTDILGMQHTETCGRAADFDSSNPQYTCTES